MSEVVRFRLVRGPDRVIPTRDELIRPLPGDEFLPALAGTARDERAGVVQQGTVLTSLSELRTKLVELDEVLAQQRNRVPPGTIVKVVGNVDAFVKSADYLHDRALLMNTLGAIIGGGYEAAVSGQATLEFANSVLRLLYVCGLLESMAVPQSPIQTPQDIYDALRWRTVVLPRELWPSATSSERMTTHGNVTADLPIYATSRRPAFADLYVVRQDWLRYEPGEVAHIENVLSGEHKEREHRRRTETEVTTFTEEELQTLDERDTQTTSRYELSTEATREVELALHVEGSVDVKTLGGPTTIAAHVGGSVDYSQATADSTATTTAREAIDRAVKRVESRVLQSRTTRVTTTVEELNKHGIDNSKREDHVVGIYRWVNKINRMQVYRYPNRFLLEFQVPEPAAWWRWMQQRTAAAGPQPPIPFTVDGTTNGATLGVADIQEGTYTQLAARYGVKAMPAPPPQELRPGANVHMEATGHNGLPVKFQQYDKFTVPDGYRAVRWDARVLTWHNGHYDNDGMQIQVSVGGTSNDGRGAGKWASMVEQVGGNLPNLTGIVPIGVMADAPWGFELAFTFICHRQDAAVRKWQQQVYDMLVDAHAQLQEAHARAMRDADDGAIAIDGDNPERNRRVVAAELKKHVIELLVSRALVGVDTIDEGNDGEPSINEPKMRAISPLVSFMEQGFEWENLTYVLYPYFWGTRAGWKERASTTSADPEFDAFLSAGSARVIVPARPGMEQVVNFFLHTGIPWMGMQAPAPDEPGYLSIDKEIRALQLGAADGVAVGDPWEVRLPTNLVWLQKDGALPANQNPTVP